ncbi:hypothetical protein G9U53_30185 [Rhodococcus sp. D-46]|jgi:hypothetical protein|uniref:Uncharacterized protein n=1 Tax=Rhodococcus baikonurensis TaxID=172041 RepID=A0ABV5XP23_9NOCA|nr:MULTISPECIES: hypothetical protein [Rhodococcus]KLN73015.1 hypothetical protein ABM90_04070 [Rhodococcus erythropolis]NHE68581.1 hypothetical protein [Rhodococcus sp. D-46]AZI65634.1 hypothetical protein EHW12_31430 [Rhodococcus sp. NJ-530]KSU63043.1 hypothetical protein AS032_33765 [Rhodococcus qingshengii]KZF17946.1 hypothetical protein A2J01_22300 [Rhodococcus sp. EPR-134]
MLTTKTPTPFQDKLTELCDAKRALDRQIDEIAMAALSEFVRNVWPEAGMLRADIEFNVYEVTTVDGGRVLASSDDLDNFYADGVDLSEMTTLVHALPPGQRGTYDNTTEYSIPLAPLR